MQNNRLIRKYRVSRTSQLNSVIQKFITSSGVQMHPISVAIFLRMYFTTQLHIRKITFFKGCLVYGGFCRLFYVYEGPI